MTAPPPPSYESTQPGYPQGYGFEGQDPYKNAAQGAYPPPQPGYPPPQQGYPPPQQGYPPQQQGYPPQPNAAWGGQPQTGYQAPPPQGAHQLAPMHGGYGDGAPKPSRSPESPAARQAVPKASDDGVWGASFSDKAVRRGFIRKVYLILFTQLLVTFGTICLFIFCKPVKNWVQTNMWFYMIAYATFLVLYITLVCCPGVRKKYPGNFICLGLFTLAFSYMTGAISSFHDTEIVLMAAGITALLCLAISLFAVQTKIDFTMCSGLLFVLCIVVFLFGIACSITFYTMGGSYIMQCVYGGLMALLFGLFLIYDTQQVMGGRKHQLSAEEYIYGALQLYIDVVYIFLIILSFFGGSSK